MGNCLPKMSLESCADLRRRRRPHQHAQAHRSAPAATKSHLGTPVADQDPAMELRWDTALAIHCTPGLQHHIADLHIAAQPTDGVITSARSFENVTSPGQQKPYLPTVPVLGFFQRHTNMTFLRWIKVYSQLDETAELILSCNFSETENQVLNRLEELML
ncbi:uncharacterized protein LOC144259115 isoform X1 [Eretmochelys imbricata]